MGYTTGRGLPIPFGFEGNNVPQDLLALAARLDVLAAPSFTYAQISALGGADLWDTRLVYQTDTGANRLWTGLYSYKAATLTWTPIVPRKSTSFTPVLKGAGTAPTYGSGNLRLGRYTRIGSQTFGGFMIYLGTSGYVNASGMLTVDCPVTANFGTLADDQESIGTWTIFDSSANTWYRAEMAIGVGVTSPPVFTGYREGNTIDFATTEPITLANSDRIFGLFVVDTAEP